jgi:hypothetical protein
LWLDHIVGKLSGGKWICNWQALLKTLEELNKDDNKDCVIYSFGISFETSKG